MQNYFTQQLQKIKGLEPNEKNFFCSALFHRLPIMLGQETRIDQNRKKNILQMSEDSDRNMIVQSMKNFVEDKLDSLKQGDLGERVYKFSGGEAVNREPMGINWLLEDTVDDLVSFSKNFLDEATVEYRYALGCDDKSKLNQKVKIFFVFETAFNQDPEILHESLEMAELQTCLDLESADLFLKMIHAMKLGFNDYLVSSLYYQNNEKNVVECKKLLLAEILFFKPDFVISLGATASKELLETPLKLSRIHGQFYPVTITAPKLAHQLQVIPLYHPEFLLINPSMKKQTWVAMQAIMAKIN